MNSKPIDTSRRCTVNRLSFRAFSPSGAFIALVCALFLVANGSGVAFAQPQQANSSVGERTALGSVSLRVLTWNVWALPAVSTHLEARVDRMGEAIAQLHPDVIALQEVWEVGFAATICSALADHGFTHSHHFFGPDGGKTGLLLVSRYPMEEVRFVPFTMGETPHTPWHLDWMTQKGVGVVQLITPVGPLGLLNTHLQSRYETDDYEGTRLSQALQVARVADQFPASHPVLVAGDFNSPHGELPRRALLARAQLADAAPGFGVDSIFYRSSENHGIDLTSIRKVLHESVSLGAGVNAPLSDHDGVLVDVVIDDGTLPSTFATVERWDQVHAETRRLFVDAASTTRTNMWLARAGGLLLLVFLVYGWLRWGRGRRWFLRGAVALTVLLVALWLSYLGVVYGPAQVAGLEDSINVSS